MKLLSASKIIVIGYAILVAFVLIAILIFKNHDKQLNEYYQNLTNSQKSALLIQQMQINAKNRSILLSQILHESDPFIEDEYIQEFLIEGNRFGAAKFQLINTMEPQSIKDEFQALDTLMKANSTRQKQIIEHALNNDYAEGQLLYQQMLPYQKQIQTALSTYAKRLKEYAHKAKQEYSQLISHDESLSSKLNFGLLISILFLAFYSYRQSKKIELKVNQDFSLLNTKMTNQLYVNALDAHILHAVDESIILCKLDGQIVRSNPSFEAIRQNFNSDCKESIWSILAHSSYKPIEPQKITAQVERLGTWKKEMELTKPFGFYAHCEVTRFEPTDIIDANLLISIRDISELKQAQTAIELQANYDAVTELPNRHFFQKILADLSQSTQARFALFYIDLDDFKHINDSLGHNYGDALLNAVSHRMHTLLLEDYIHQFHLARIGGDEFAIILQIETITPTKPCSKLADKLVKTVSQPYRINDETIEIGCSIGVSLFPEHSTSATQLMRNADLAMYEAKHNGKNQFVFFDDFIKQKLEQRIEMQQRIETALRNKEFVLHYQPQYNLNTNEIIGLEALIRWQGEQICYQPEEFIPFAEDNGLIQLIDEYVIKMACKQISDWLKQGITLPRVAINISSKQTCQDNILKLIEEQLEQHSIDGSYLELEVTEYSLISQNDDNIQSNNWVQALHDKGVHISIDDFGTGYSSLSYLQHLHINRLKIDKSFIKNMIQEKESLSITESIINLGHNVGATVLAEGVETEEQYQCLLDLGCDEIQGHLLNYPLNADEVVQLLK